MLRCAKEPKILPCKTPISRQHKAQGKTRVGESVGVSSGSGKPKEPNLAVAGEVAGEVCCAYTVSEMGVLQPIYASVSSQWVAGEV